MDEKTSKVSRRSFIKRSSFLVGALGGSAFVAAGSKEASAHSHNEVLQNYPWHVAVDAKSRISLYLCRGLNVAQLFDRAFVRNIGHMRRRAQRPDTRLQAALNSLGCTQDDLKDKLSDSMTTIEVYDPVHTYTWYCQTSMTSWNSKVKLSLESLAECMLLPLFYTDRQAVGDFLTTYVSDIEKFTKRRSVRALFTCKDYEIDGIGSAINELDLFRRARNVGLLWCKARTPYLTSEGVADPLTIPNGRKCSGGVCVPGDADDYCQEVDGVCSGMST